MPSCEAGSHPASRGPQRRRPARVLTALTALAVIAGACGPPEDQAEIAPAETDSPPSVVVADNARLFERQVAFFETESDGAPLAVGWWFRTETDQPSPRREVIGWIGRGGSWDGFFQDAWITGPDRTPWRIHPRSPMRLRVGLGDALEAIRYRSEGRYLDVRVDSTLASWREARGGTVRLDRASVSIQDRAAAGLVIDLQRARGLEPGASRAWTEWFLLVGEETEVVLVGGEPGRWTGWIRIASADEPLPPIASEWTGRRVVDDARREVPTGWTLSTDAGELVAELDVTSFHLEPLEGPGPVFPVEGLQSVEGFWIVSGDSIAVSGLQRLSRR